MKKINRTHIPYIGYSTTTIVFILISLWLCHDTVGKGINIAAALIMLTIVLCGYGRPANQDDQRSAGLSALH